MRPGAACRRPGAGFTLVELAVTLLIVAVLLGGVLIPLQTQVEIRKIEDTQRILERARDALLGYAAAFGYFPCPADSTSAGREPAAGVDHVLGVCPSYHGFFPAALLGFTPVDAEGFALDSWGGAAPHRIRYAVSNHDVGGITNPFTRSGGMSAAGIPSLGAATNLYHVCGSGAGVNPGADCGTAATLANNGVVVLWSAGQNATSGGTSVHEAEHPNPNTGGSADRIFVSRVRVTFGAGEFDDHLLWVSNFAVVKSLVASGQLP
jgi:prepilin-type N-terminal cleavage/methylation domain-containing protein